MSESPSITSPIRVPSPKLELPTVSEQSVRTSVKQDAQQTKQGASELGNAVQDTWENSDKNTDAIKGKGKETGTKLEEAKDKIGEAASAAGQTASEAVTGLENIGDQARANAGQAAEGVNQASTGVFNMVKRPVVWAANKVSALGTNIVTPRSGERFSPAFGAALALGGTALFTAAAAASWSATLFINLPTLALGTALLGATLLGTTLLGRIFGSPVAPSTTEGVLAAGTPAHRAIVEMNTTREATLTKLEAEKKTVLTKREKLVTKQEAISNQTADLATREAELQNEIDILNSVKVNAADAVTIEKATPVDAKALPAINQPKVKAVATTSDTVEVLESKVVQDIKVESSTTVEENKAA